jgi:hypothetical protein
MYAFRQITAKDVVLFVYLVIFLASRPKECHVVMQDDRTPIPSCFRPYDDIKEDHPLRGT